MKKLSILFGLILLAFIFGSLGSVNATWSDYSVTTTTTTTIQTAPITVSRNLPDSGNAGNTITVTLDVVVIPDLITGLVIWEYVPLGWTVTSSSPTYNSFNSETGRVTWVLYGGTLVTQTITYGLEIPSSENISNKTFSGTADYVYDGNQVDNISGDTSMSVLESTTTTTPTTTTIPPVSVERDIPSIAAGECDDVELEVTLGTVTGITWVIVKEYVPSADWDVTDTDPAADSYTASIGEVKWVLYGASFVSQTLTYTVCAPDDATGDEEFSGEFLYNDADGTPVTEVIAGDTEVSEESGTTRRRRYMIMTITGGEEAGDVITITITDKNTEDPLDDVDIDIYLDGTKLFSELTDDDGIVEFTPTAPGTYLITADLTRYRDEEQEIVVGGESMTTTTSIFSADSETEPNDNFTAANLAYFGSTITGSIDDDLNDDDYFKIYLNYLEELTVTLQVPIGADFDLYLYNPFQNLVDYSLGVGSYETVSTTATESGYYYVKISSFFGNDSYEITFSGTGSGTTTLTTTTTTIFTVTTSILPVRINATGDYIQDTNFLEELSYFYDEDKGLYFDNPVAYTPTAYETGDFNFYVWNNSQPTITSADLLLKEKYGNIHCVVNQTPCEASVATPSHPMEERISVDYDNVFYYEYGINDDDSEALRMALEEDSIKYIVETNYMPMKLITENIFGSDPSDYIDFEYRGKIMFFGEEYYVREIDGVTKIYLSKGELINESGNITIDYNLSQRVFLEDGEDIEVNGVIWDDWEVIFHIVDTCANASIDPDFDSDGPECEILEYNEMDPLTTDGLLQEIEIIYGHKLDGVEALEKGESLEFPGGEVRLKFKGYTNENYLESPCSGGSEGNIQIEPGDENYQMTISFTGEDGNRYDDIRLDEGPFGKGNYFIVGGVLYVYDKYKTLDNEEGMDSDDQIKVALFPPINGNEQSILLDRLCDPEDEQGTAPGCDYITTFCDCEDVPEEITVRTIALTDAMDDDDEEDMENDDEIEIAIEDIFYKDNAINGLTMLFDGSRLITFLDNLSDTYITVNPNMVGIFGDFERNDHNLYLWIEHECDLTRDLNSTDDNTATCDENGDGDDDDILVGFVHGNGERAIIDLSDRNYNAIETFDYDNGVALFESTTHIVTLDENIDSVLITPQGGDSYTLGWSTNNRLDLVGLCHPIDDVKPTLFLGTTENEIYGPKGDLDGDGTVSDYELLDYIDLWGGGEVADYDLLEVIDNWSG